jgi:hypothetical protein
MTIYGGDLMSYKYFVLLLCIVLTACNPPSAAIEKDLPDTQFAVSIHDDFSLKDTLDYWNFSYGDFTDTASLNYRVLTRSHTNGYIPYKGLELGFIEPKEHSFIALSRQIDYKSLNPNHNYIVTIDFDLATNISCYEANEKGAPAFESFLKLGVLTEEPLLENPYNFDFGKGKLSGKDLLTLDHLGHQKKSGDFAIKSYSQSFKVRTTSTGELWLILGLESFHPDTLRVILRNMDIYIYED